MPKALYEKFVLWALENYGAHMEANHGEFLPGIYADDLQEAAKDWRKRMQNGVKPKLKADMRPVGAPRQIPLGTKCQNPHICGSVARIIGPGGLFICCDCSRRYKKTGSLAPGIVGRPKVQRGPCACGKPATRKGDICNSCYARNRYANKRKGE